MSVVNAGITLALDATTFTVDAAGMKTTYNLDGSPTTAQYRGTDATAVARWDGDSIVIDLTSQNGSVRTKYSIEGSDLVRETTSGTSAPRKTYYKKG